MLFSYLIFHWFRVYNIAVYLYHYQQVSVPFDQLVGKLSGLVGEKFLPNIPDFESYVVVLFLWLGRCVFFFALFLLLFFPCYYIGLWLLTLSQLLVLVSDLLELVLDLLVQCLFLVSCCLDLILYWLLGSYIDINA